MADNDRAATRTDFQRAVNMTGKQLEAWLETDESHAVGQKAGGRGESTGQESGRRIPAVLNTNKNDLDDDDYAHMRKVVGYIKRHLAQRPSGDIEHASWRYSLMNRGHDPRRES